MDINLLGCLHAQSFVPHDTITPEVVQKDCHYHIIVLPQISIIGTMQRFVPLVIKISLRAKH